MIDDSCMKNINKSLKTNPANIRHDADENNKSINSENDLDNKASNFGNLENARSVVIWTYDDTRDINDLSEGIELDDGYVVAHVSDIKEEGTKNIDEVENSIRKKIIDDKKFNYLLNYKIYPINLIRFPYNILHLNFQPPLQ